MPTPLTGCSGRLLPARYPDERSFLPQRAQPAMVGLIGSLDLGPHISPATDARAGVLGVGPDGWGTHPVPCQCQ
jgi:hypothetical protein